MGTPASRPATRPAMFAWYRNVCSTAGRICFNTRRSRQRIPTFHARLPPRQVTDMRDSLSVSDVVRAYGSDRRDADLVRRASVLPALPEEWRQHFRDQLARLEG